MTPAFHSRFLPFFVLLFCLFAGCSHMAPSAGSAGPSSGLGAGGGAPVMTGTAVSGDGADGGSSSGGAEDTADSGMKQKSDGQDIHNKGKCLFFEALYDSKPEIPILVFSSPEGMLTLKLSLLSQSMLPGADGLCDKSLLDSTAWAPAPNWRIQLVYSPAGKPNAYQQCYVDSDTVTISADAGQISMYAVAVDADGTIEGTRCADDLAPFPSYIHYDPNETRNNGLGSFKVQTLSQPSTPSYNPNY